MQGTQINDTKSHDSVGLSTPDLTSLSCLTRASWSISSVYLEIRHYVEVANILRMENQLSYWNIKLNIQLLTRLKNHLDANSILLDTQHGFRQQHSPIHNLARVTKHLKTAQTNINSTGLVTLEKAFVSIFHNRLIHKMVIFNFSPARIESRPHC